MATIVNFVIFLFRAYDQDRNLRSFYDLISTQKLISAFL